MLVAGAGEYRRDLAPRRSGLRSGAASDSKAAAMVVAPDDPRFGLGERAQDTADDGFRGHWL